MKTIELGEHIARRLARMLAWFERHGPGEAPPRPRTLPSAVERVRPFELKDALTPGSNATAYVLKDGTPDTDDEFEVYDPLAKYRGRALDAYSSPHAVGSRGLARYNAFSEHWEVIELQQSAAVIRGQLTAALTGAATFTIDGAAVAQPIGGLITDQDPAGNITVYNICTWSGDDDGEVFAIWNEATDHWEALQIECPA